MFNNLGDVDFNFLPHNIQCNIKVNRIFWLWINNSLLKLLNMILFSFNSSRFQYMIKILNYEIYLTFRCWHHQWHQCLKQCRSMRIVILLVISVDWLRMTWQICLILKAEERLFQIPCSFFWHSLYILSFRLVITHPSSLLGTFLCSIFFGNLITNILKWLKFDWKFSPFYRLLPKEHQSYLWTEHWTWLHQSATHLIVCLVPYTKSCHVWKITIMMLLLICQVFLHRESESFNTLVSFVCLVLPL